MSGESSCFIRHQRIEERAVCLINESWVWKSFRRIWAAPADNGGNSLVVMKLKKSCCLKSTLSEETNIYNSDSFLLLLQDFYFTEIKSIAMKNGDFQSKSSMAPTNEESWDSALLVCFSLFLSVFYFNVSFILYFTISLFNCFNFYYIIWRLKFISRRHIIKVSWLEE